jgi:nicotinamidase/pyrazinamidase
MLGGVGQVLWPDHCVQGTPGASFHSGLEIAGVSHVIRKGTDPAIDSYSGFFDNDHRSATGLESLLRSLVVDRVTVCGLATDYCVLYTALDARRLGFGVRVVVDGCRAVDLAPGDGERALETMREAGCELVKSAEVAAP